MGLFGGKKKVQASASSAANEDEVDEIALEAVAALLRTLGRNVISLDATPPEQVTRRFEDWARHVLVRAPAPDAAPSSSSGKDGAQRDWPSMQRFVADHRRNEAALVAETVAGLREAARAFIRSMTRLRLVGDSADLGVRKQVERLRHAAQSSSPVELKRDVLAAADALEVAVEARRSQEETVAADLAGQVKDLSQQLERALREGGTDPLTRVANRKSFDAAVAEAVEICAVTREPFSLVMIDLDDFKGINDTYGHGAGDDVLKGVADALSRVVLRQRDLVARWAGDEFAVLLRDCPAQSARPLVQRVADAVRALSFERNGARFGIHASFGIAAMVTGDSAESLVERADAALYQAKRGGKDDIVIASADMVRPPS